MISSIEKQRLLEKFEEDGFIILKGIIPINLLEEARKELEKIVDHHAEMLFEKKLITDKFENEAFVVRMFKLYEHCLQEAPHLFRTELHKEGFYGLFFNPKLLDFVQELIGNEIRLYPNYTVRPKFPEYEGTRVLWHQDGGYTEKAAGSEDEDSVDQLRMTNIWAPLVPATKENGCMQFIAGTHRLGSVPHVKKKYYLEIADEYLLPRLKDAIDIELNPGDIVMFHNLLFHQGQPNLSKQIRWSVDWRYQDAIQSTLRRQNGHIARSLSNSEQVVKNKEEWAGLSFS